VIFTDIRFVGECGRVNRQEHHVVAAGDQLGGHGVVAQATAAIHSTRAAREIKNPQVQSSNGNGVLECTARVKMIEEIAFVRLIPTDLVGGERADVQTIDARGGD
jgi:hypothetical protein